MSTEVEEGWA